MSKGISLEDFKKQLEGSAQQKVEEQEKYIRKLEGQLQKAKLKNIEQDQEAYFLFNRCRALSMGTLCQHCGLSQRCNDIRIIYDAKNKIDGEPTTVDEVIGAELRQELTGSIPSDRLELYMTLGQLFKPE